MLCLIFSTLGDGVETEDCMAYKLKTGASVLARRQRALDLLRDFAASLSSEDRRCVASVISIGDV